MDLQKDLKHQFPTMFYETKRKAEYLLALDIMTISKENTAAIALSKKTLQILKQFY